MKARPEPHLCKAPSCEEKHSPDNPLTGWNQSTAFGDQQSTSIYQNPSRGYANTNSLLTVQWTALTLLLYIGGHHILIVEPAERLGHRIVVVGNSCLNRLFPVSPYDIPAIGSHAVVNGFEECADAAFQ